MRITIEPTARGLDGEFPNSKVILELPTDDVFVEDALDMVKRALVAWGFHWSNIFDE